MKTIQIRLVDEQGVVLNQTTQKVTDAENAFADLESDLESMSRDHE